MPRVPKRITDDEIKVRQLSHYQFTWVAGDPQKNGTFTLQLVLDEGAWEEVVAVTAEDAEVLQGLLKRAEFLVAGRALREVVVRRIADRQFAAGESSQHLRGGAPFARRIRMRAPEEQVHFVFNSEVRRVRAVTAVRHRLSQLSVFVAATKLWC